jgi:hypothetical protein
VPRRRSTLLLLGAALAGCGGSDFSAPLVRSGRLGSLRDLFLFARADAAGGPFFLDCFEVTRGDWLEFARTAAGRAVRAPPPHIERMDDDSLPMAGVDLVQARAFAHWRCCRLPRDDEWSYACTSGNHNVFPWGEAGPQDDVRANTQDLGFGGPTPVGAFESGRVGESGPYDMIGNVAEWSETVPKWWFREDRDGLRPVWSARCQLTAAAGMAAWALPGAPWSPVLIVEAARQQAPREVLGSAFAQPRAELVVERLAGERGDTIGLRLCTSPGELLVALARDRSSFDREDRRQLERFVRRDGHAEVLRSALAEFGDDGPLDAAARRWCAELLR